MVYKYPHTNASSVRNRRVRPVHSPDRYGRLLTGLVLLACGGCVPNLTGTWHMTKVDPPGAPFPLEQVTFDESGRYSAAWSNEGEKHTSMGAYRQSRNRLEIAQDGRQSRAYSVKRHANDSVVLTYREGGATMSATLVRQGSR